MDEDPQQAAERRTTDMLDQIQLLVAVLLLLMMVCVGLHFVPLGS
jgi:hypothetical protein